MATKPTLSNARWGETAGGSTVGANLTAPSGGSRDIGFQPSTPAVSAYVNWLLHEMYLWAKYLDDGIFDGDVSFTGDITGDTNFTGNVTVGGSFEALGLYWSSAVTRTYNAGYAVPLAGSAASHATAGQLELATSTVYSTCPLDVVEGESIGAWGARLNKNSASGTITAELVEQDSAGNQVQLGTTRTNNANAPGAIQLSETITPVPVVSGRSYFIRVAGGGVVTGGISDRLVSYSVTTVRPGP